MKKVQGQIEEGSATIIQAVSDMFKKNSTTNGGFAKGGNKRTSDGRPICNQCGRPGHIARNCGKPEDQQRKCHKCGDPGHFANRCSKNPTTPPNSNPSTKPSN